MQRDYSLPGDVFLWVCLGIVFVNVGHQVTRTIHRLAEELPESTRSIRLEEKPQQDNEDQENAANNISNESLSVLATSQNPNIRKAATRIFLDRFLANKSACEGLFHNLASAQSPRRRENANRALRLLQDFGYSTRQFVDAADFGHLHEQHAGARSADAGSNFAHAGDGERNTAVDTDGDIEMGGVSGVVEIDDPAEIAELQEILRPGDRPGWIISSPRNPPPDADAAWEVHSFCARVAALDHLFDSEDYQALEPEQQQAQLNHALRIGRVQADDGDTTVPLYPASMESSPPLDLLPEVLVRRSRIAADMVRHRIERGGLRPHEHDALHDLLRPASADGTRGGRREQGETLRAPGQARPRPRPPTEVERRALINVARRAIQEADAQGRRQPGDSGRIMPDGTWQLLSRPTFFGSLPRSQEDTVDQEAMLSEAIAQPLPEPPPRPRAQVDNAEEVARRRRRREAMVINEGDQPLSERDIIQRRRTDDFLREMGVQRARATGPNEGGVAEEDNAGENTGWSWMGAWRNLWESLG